MKKVEKLYLWVITVLTISLIGKEGREAEKIKQVKVGNFALPGSQQPSPLIAFGQNTIDKGDLLLFSYVQQIKGSQTNFIEVNPFVIYGLTDKSSLLIVLPIATHFESDNATSRGVEDLTVEFEYAVYSQETTTTYNEITVVADILFPTGSSHKEPPTGSGSFSFLLGFTASHLATDWYYFTSGGALLKSSHRNTKFGNEFLYQFGLGRNIAYKPDKWIFNILVELDGIYRQRDKLCGSIDCNSGGNQLMFGPSLFFSTQRLVLQLGISGFISQHLFGIQPKDKYLIAADVGWKF